MFGKIRLKECKHVLTCFSIICWAQRVKCVLIWIMHEMKSRYATSLNIFNNIFNIFINIVYEIIRTFLFFYNLSRYEFLKYMFHKKQDDGYCGPEADNDPSGTPQNQTASSRSSRLQGIAYLNKTASTSVLLDVTTS